MLDLGAGLLEARAPHLRTCHAVAHWTMALHPGRLLTQWTWVWVNSRSWWWTGRPGLPQSMGWQRVGDNWATELTELKWTEDVFRKRGGSTTRADASFPYLGFCFYSFGFEVFWFFSVFFVFFCLFVSLCPCLIIFMLFVLFFLPLFLIWVFVFVLQ